MEELKIVSGALVALILAITQLACHTDCDDPTNVDCSNFDPCYGEFRANADFDIMRMTVGDDTVFWFSDPTDDTIYAFFDGVPVYFRSKYGADSVKWKVGLDPRIFTDSIFKLLFPADAGPIKVTQVAYHHSKEGCFPEDDGVDTVTHNVYFKKITSLSEHPLCCNYWGALEDNPTDSFEVKIFDPAIHGGIVLPEVGGYYIKVSSTEFVGDIKHFAHEPRLFGKLQPDRKTLVIEYSFLKNGKRVEKRFVGVKE